MRLKISGIESEIDLNNKINVLEIENKALFKNIVTKLNDVINYKEEEADITLSDGEQVLDMNKYIQIIIDPFNIDFNSKDILGKLYGKLEQLNSLESAINDEYIRITNELIAYTRDLANDLTFDCNVAEKISFKDILKIVSLKIDGDQYQKLEDKIMFFIDLISEFELCKSLVFVSIKQYFTNEELEIIYKYAISKEVGIVLLENSSSEKLKLEHKVIIDNDFEDFCEE